MGSYCSLQFDDADIRSSKSVVPDVYISLFQEADRVVLPTAKQPTESDEADDDRGRIIYRATRNVILQRLDLMGFTAERARKAFGQWQAHEQSMFEEWVREGSDWAQPSAEAIGRLTYGEWCARVPDTLQSLYDPDHERSDDEIAKHMCFEDSEWLFFDVDDERTLLRAILDACPLIQNVSLDISDLVYGGYLEEDVQLCLERRMPDALTRPTLEPAVIMAEGSSDIRVLQSSLAKLFPHLTAYFTFFEHTELSVDGGATYLVKFLKAFAAAGIQSRVVAIFDNDTIGSQAFAAASALDLPSNIKVLRLPDIEIARSYPTVGPQGTHLVDVNGRGGSIELYLGRQNLLAPNGDLVPVRWAGYVQGMNAYQGVIENKARIVQLFEAEIAFSADPHQARASHPELVATWEMIFAALRE